jgi:MoaA/NifB/PqqE/SkfB family radical SAM enzyme/glycosyltransferase involved in cell wall biosynthesis
MQKVLFGLRCDFASGGCLKVRDYYRHVQHSPDFSPLLYLPADTVLDADNPWHSERNSIVPEYDPELADILFISGLGWERFIPLEYRRHSPKPIIYLIQGLFKLRQSPYRESFAYPAIRISVSNIITHALQAEKIQVNGPLFTIPNGIDTENLPAPLSQPQKDIDILVLGWKRPELSAPLVIELKQKFPSQPIVHLPARLPHAQFIAYLNRAKLAVFLPMPEEGFYLAPLENMGLNTLAICPDAGGNREFCRDQYNCLMPEYSIAGLVTAVEHALRLPENAKQAILLHGRETLSRHDLKQERNAFLDILRNADSIWRGLDLTISHNSKAQATDMIPDTAPTQANTDNIASSSVIHSALMANGYLAEKSQTLESFCGFAEGYGMPQWPVEIFLEISNLCDLKCAMCHTFSQLNPRRFDNLKAEERGFLAADATTTLDTLLRHALLVHCYGYGEPTIHPDFQPVLAEISQYGVLIDFFTNGMHLSEELCEFLVEKRIFRVVVSFSGVTAEEYENMYIGGNFRAVLDNMARLNRIKREKNSKFPEIEINSLGFKHQLENMVEFVDLMAAHGANLISLKPLNGFEGGAALAGHTALYRPEIEGEILRQARRRAEEKGVVLLDAPFVQTMAAENQGYLQQRGKIWGASDSAETIPLQQIKTLAKQVTPSRSDEGRLPVETAWGQADVDEWLQLQAPASPIKTPCLEPFKTFYVTKNNGVKPCCFSSPRQNLLGTLEQAPALQLWQGETFNRTREGMLEGKYPMRLCGQRCLPLSLYPGHHSLHHYAAAYAEWFRQAHGSAPFADMLWRKLQNLPDNAEIMRRHRK